MIFLILDLDGCNKREFWFRRFSVHRMINGSHFATFLLNRQ